MNTIRFGSTLSARTLVKSSERADLSCGDSQELVRDTFRMACCSEMIVLIWFVARLGKSYFLRFALLKALESGRPVAFCYKSNFFLLFDSDGPKKLKYVDVDDDELPPNTLALCDSNVTLSTPLDPFVSPSSTSFIVQATSPKIARWYEWSKQKAADFWTMDLWSKEEISAWR